MSIAITQLHYIFGLKSGVVGNICFHDEQTIVYPAGANCVVYNIDQKSQKFIPSNKISQPALSILHCHQMEHNFVDICLEHFFLGGKGHTNFPVFFFLNCNWQENVTEQN